VRQHCPPDRGVERVCRADFHVEIGGPVPTTKPSTVLPASGATEPSVTPSRQREGNKMGLSPVSDESCRSRMPTHTNIRDFQFPPTSALGKVRSARLPVRSWGRTGRCWRESARPRG